MNPVSLMVVPCSKPRRPAPIQRRARATVANASPWRRNCSARPIARLKVGARLETSLERVASGGAVTSPRAARFLCASSNPAIGWVTPWPRALLRANEFQLRARRNAGGCFLPLGRFTSRNRARRRRHMSSKGALHAPARALHRPRRLLAPALALGRDRTRGSALAANRMLRGLTRGLICYAVRNCGVEWVKWE